MDAADVSAALPHAAYRLLDRRLVWAYEGEALPAYLDREIDEVGVFHARCYLAGGGAYRSAEGSFTARPGRWFLAPARRYRQRIRPGSRHRAIRFRAHWPTGHGLYDPSTFLDLGAAEEVARAGNALCAAVSRTFPGRRHHLTTTAMDPATWAGIEIRFATWLSAVIQAFETAGLAAWTPANLDARIQRVLSWLDGAIGSGPTDLTTAARIAGCSTNHLGRLLHASCGLGYHDLLDRRRLERAQRLLEAGQAAKAVAAACGLPSAAYFSRWFRHRSGTTPTAYAAAHRS